MGRQSLASLQAKSAPIQGLGLSLEYALGRPPLEGASAAQRAWSARLEGKAWGLVPLLAEEIHAGPDYPGFYHDTDASRLQFTVPLSGQLDFNALYDRRASNLNRDPARGTALEEQRARAGLRLTRSRETIWTLDYERQLRKDRLPLSTADSSADQATLGLTRLWGPFNAHVSGTAFRIDDRLSAHAYAAGGGGADVTYSPAYTQSYSASFQSGPQGLAVDSPRETVVALGVDLTPLQNLNLSAQIERRDQGAAGSASMRYAENLRWRFLTTESFSLRAQQLDYLRNARARDRSVLASYTHEFAIPIVRRGDLGSLTGTLYDAEDPARGGIADAVIKVGGALAATDGRGRFQFLSLEKGEHYLWVENASLGKGLVTRLKTPLKISIEGGASRRLDIGVVRAATLNLRVTLFEPESGAAVTVEGEETKRLVEAGRVSGVWIELSRDDETITRPTDAAGEVKFRNLRPGLWRVRVGPAGLPDKHYAETSEFETELLPGREEKRLLRVLPRLRKLIPIEEK